MTAIQVLISFLIFVVVTLAAFGLMTAFRAQPMAARLRQVAATGAAAAPAAVPVRSHLARLLKPLGNIWRPEEGWEATGLRSRFLKAGYRSDSAIVAYFGAKTLLTFLLPTLFILQIGIGQLNVGMNRMLLLVLLLAGLGYFLPNLYLRQRIAMRQRELFEALPDALDLMTVCVEAGLALDAAISRVGEEMRLRSPALAEEFHLARLELRAGATRERALRNIALRTGVEDIDSLVAMLVQADRFGTSIADSLRVHADGLRTKRRLRAEERAAKIPVKLLMPLIFCIFPSLLLVLLGPAFIAIYRVLVPTMLGQG